MESPLFANTTKHICACSAVSISLIVLFVISPLRTMWKTSVCMKTIALIVLGYTFYLNILQTNLYRQASNNLISPQLQSQLTINLMSSYVFAMFIGLLIIFLFKSFFV